MSNKFFVGQPIIAITGDDRELEGLIIDYDFVTEQYEVLFSDQELLPRSMYFPKERLKRLSRTEPTYNKCECGTTATLKNAPNSAHSSWCPIYRRP